MKRSAVVGTIALLGWVDQVSGRIAAPVSRAFAIISAMCVLGLGLSASSAPDHQKLASANAAFAFKLLKQLAKERPEANLFVSPFCASSVLQMACNGAAGQTKAEMQAVLGTTGPEPDAVNASNWDLATP